MLAQSFSNFSILGTFPLFSFLFLCPLCFVCKTFFVHLNYSFIKLRILASRIFIRSSCFLRYLNSSNAFFFTYTKTSFLFSGWSAKIAFCFLVIFLFVILLLISLALHAVINLLWIALNDVLHHFYLVSQGD